MKFIALAERGLVLLGILGVIAMIVSHKPETALPQQQIPAQPATAETMPVGPSLHDFSSR